MVVFDARGRFIKSWGAEFEGGAHGLHINKEGSNSPSGIPSSRIPTSLERIYVVEWVEVGRVSKLRKV